jgi:hypothetical protein
MTGHLRRHAAFLVRWPRLTAAASVLAAGLLATGAGRLTVELDPERQLPAADPYLAVDRLIREEFGGRRFVAIAIVPRTGNVWRGDVLRSIYDMTLEFLDAPGIIRQNVLSLSSPYVRVPDDRDGTLSVEYLMRDVPTEQSGIEALRDRYRREPLVRGTVVSRDERAAMLLLDFYPEMDAEEIGASIDRVIARHRSPRLRIAVTGGPIIERTERMLVEGQSLFFVGTVATIGAVLWLAFGHVQAVVLPLATALLSTACALGTMGWAGMALDPWTAAVPVMVVTVAAGHAAQMLKAYYETFGASAHVGDQRAAVEDATVRVGGVMIAAGGTAAGSFAALSLLRIPVLTHFGLGVAAGIGAAVALELSFMPAVRVLWPLRAAPRAGGWLSRALGPALHTLSALVLLRPRTVVAGGVLAVLCAVGGYPWLSTEVNTRTYWDDTTDIGRDLRVFERHFPGTTTLTVLLEGEPGSMQTHEALTVMRDLQRVMASDPGVVRTSSLADIIRRTYEVFVPEEATNELPADRRLTAQLVFLAQSPAFERYVDRSYSRAVVYGFLDRQESGLTRRVLERLETHLVQHPPAGLRVLLAGGVGPALLAVNAHTIKGKMLNMLVVFAVIVATAGVLLRAPLGGLYVAVPLLVGLAVNLGLFAWLGVAFDLGGASIAAIGAGLGADYALYTLFRLRSEYRRCGTLAEALTATMQTTGRAVAVVALAIGGGFAVYLGSDFYPLRMAGVFVPLTMLVTCLAALTLLPALVLLLRPRFVLGAVDARGGADVDRIRRVRDSRPATGVSSR